MLQGQATCLWWTFEGPREVHQTRQYTTKPFQNSESKRIHSLRRRHYGSGEAPVWTGQNFTRALNFSKATPKTIEKKKGIVFPFITRRSAQSIKPVHDVERTNGRKPA